LITRFRAYQLGCEGSSFSYGHCSSLTLIEARLTSRSVPSVFEELKAFGGTLQTLHITSWDSDHCAPAELELILEHLQPAVVELPGYQPHTDCGRAALAAVFRYEQRGVRRVHWSPENIQALTTASGWAKSNILCWPLELSLDSNDNSTVKLFRSGHFTVLSLGDVEDPAIADHLISLPCIREEVDVMILAHHGADNGFTTERFVRTVRPSVAICCSNFDNQYEHPRQDIRDLLYACGVPIFTTKTGDVLIESAAPDRFQLTNLITNSSEVSFIKHFYTKRRLAGRMVA
jgi:competence protein ComEC